ncbi:MAG: glycosyltransferase family 39 protein, partial [Anaerolineales bacterium]|nr:glycosyltransferase family 39 protein [Anaerolineales bacterium]
MVPVLPHNTSRLLARLLPIVLLLVVFWSALTSLHYSSPTYDEHEYLSRGYLYQQTGSTSLKLRHPILLDALAAAPLRLLPDIVLSADDPAITAGDFHLFAARFMWEANGTRVPQIFFLARLPAIALLLLLIAAVFGWARARFGLLAGLVAMTLAAFDPNLLAHGRLITPDVGQTAFIFLSAFCWWRYWQKSTLGRLLTAALLLGLAQTAGYPALVLYPLFLVIGGVTVWQRPDRRAAVWFYLRDYVILVAVSGLVIWAIYGFSWGPVDAFGFMIPLPAPYYWEEFLDLLTRLSRQDIAYLNGEVYRGGRWQFFVVGLLVKTPLPILILSASGLILFFYCRALLRDVSLWLIELF